MSRVYGKVLVQGTDLGIPNLVVTAFDLDPAARGDAASVAPRGEEHAIHGARLGAVITDRNGSFELEYDPWSKGRPGSEIRPDLVVTVSAPEDSRGLRNPNPQPPERLLLHVSRRPRVDASPIEGFVIRIPRAQLEELGIPFRPARVHRDARSHADTLTTAAERSWALRDAVRERLAPRLQEEAERDSERRKKAKEWTQRLRLSPRHKDQDPLLARDHESAMELHELVVRAGMARMEHYKPKVRLNLVEGDLESFELNRDGDEVSRTISVEKLTRMVFGVAASPDLVRRRDLMKAAETPQQRLEALKHYVAEEEARHGSVEPAGNEGGVR